MICLICGMELSGEAEKEMIAVEKLLEVNEVGKPLRRKDKIGERLEMECRRLEHTHDGNLL